MVRYDLPEIFQYLKSAVHLQTLETHVGKSDDRIPRLTKYNWHELDRCLVGIKGRTRVTVCNDCTDRGTRYEVNCEGQRNRCSSVRKWLVCEAGQEKWRKARAYPEDEIMRLR